MLSADTKEKLLKQVKLLLCCRRFIFEKSEHQLSSGLFLQLEFYFSDSNLPRDKFLRGKTQEDPEVR